MKKIYLGFSVLLLALGMASCSQEDAQNIADQGQIEISVSANRQLIGSRAGENGDTPDVDDFSLTVTSPEGEEVASCKKLSAFEPVTVKAGTYTVNATYGDASAEGFDALSYAGSEEVVVKRKETTQATVTCTINKALVYIDYTDDFKKYFSQYDSYISTSKGKSIAYTADESRAAYFVPGNLEVYMNVQKAGSDKSVRLNPQNFTAEARHEYHLTMDVDASTTTLKVSFNDELKDEDVTIDVSDEALNAPAPVFTTQGFTSGETLEYVEGFCPKGDYNLYLNAQGGIAKLNLDVQSAWWTANGKASQIDMVSENIKNGYSWGVSGSGITVIGLSENRGKIANLNLYRMLKGISCQGSDDEEHTFTFTATDKMTKASEPAVLKVKTLSDQLAVQENGTAVFGENTIDLKINVRGASSGDIEDNFTYYYKAADEDDFTELDWPVSSVTKGTSDNEWNVSLELEDVEFAAGDMQLKVTSPAGHSRILNYKVEPDLVLSYNSEGDIWAKKAIVQVKPRNKGSFSNNNVKLQYQDGDTWKDLAYTYKKGEGYTLTGLTASTTYTVRELFTLGSDTYPSNTITFTTEAASQVDNSGFETWKSTNVWHQEIWLSGGENIYKYDPYSSNGWWETVNGITTQSQSGVASWYYCAYPGTMPTNASECHTATWHLNNHDSKSLATSAHSGSAAAELATVGYGANNWSDLSHNTSNRQAGMLYIGTFDSNNKKPVYGHSFSSRPTSVGFYYRFYSYNSETTKAYAKIFASDGSTIGEGELKVTSATDSWTQGTINITYSNTQKKASSLTIVFMSTDASSPATKDIQGSKGAWKAGYGDSRHIGSIFTVDDVTLNY